MTFGDTADANLRYGFVQLWCDIGGMAAVTLGRTSTSKTRMNRFPDYTRRHFLKASSLATAGLFSSNVIFAKGKNVKAKGGPVGAFERNADTLKVGLIGCGGRGTGAAAQA